MAVAIARAVVCACFVRTANCVIDAITVRIAQPALTVLDASTVPIAITAPIVLKASAAQARLFWFGVRTVRTAPTVLAA